MRFSDAAVGAQDGDFQRFENVSLVAMRSITAPKRQVFGVCHRYLDPGPTILMKESSRLHDLLFRLFPAIQVIYKLGFEPKEESFHELTPEEYRHLERSTPYRLVELDL